MYWQMQNKKLNLLVMVKKTISFAFGQSSELAQLCSCLVDYDEYKAKQEILCLT